MWIQLTTVLAYCSRGKNSGEKPPSCTSKKSFREQKILYNVEGEGGGDFTSIPLCYTNWSIRTTIIFFTRTCNRTFRFGSLNFWRHKSPVKWIVFRLHEFDYFIGILNFSSLANSGYYIRLLENRNFLNGLPSLQLKVKKKCEMRTDSSVYLILTTQSSYTTVRVVWGVSPESRLTSCVVPAWLQRRETRSLLANENKITIFTKMHCADRCSSQSIRKGMSKRYVGDFTAKHFSKLHLWMKHIPNLPP